MMDRPTTTPAHRTATMQDEVALTVQRQLMDFIEQLKTRYDDELVDQIVEEVASSARTQDGSGEVGDSV